MSLDTEHDGSNPDEFYEDKEARRSKRAWRLFWMALGVFLVVASLPVIQDRIYKWRSVGDARRLAVWAQDQRLRAIQERLAIRFQIASLDSERVAIAFLGASCRVDDEKTFREIDRKPFFDETQYTWIDEQNAKKLELKPSASVACIDSPVIQPDFNQQLFWAWLPYQDLASKRLDRVTVVRYDPKTSSFDFQ